MHEYYTTKIALISIDIQLDLDNYFVQDAISFCNKFSIEKIYFSYVIDASQYDKKAVLPTKEEVKEKIKQKITPYLEKIPDYEVIVKKDAFTITTLKLIQTLQIDLIIIAKQKTLEELGYFAKKIIRRALSAILVLPQTENRVKVNQLKKILVPVDFSNCCKLSLRKAITLARINKSKIICYHGYKIPSGQYSTGKTEKEIKEIIQRNAKKKMEYLIKQFDTLDIDIETRFEFLKSHRKIGKFIFNQAQYEDIDMIIINARGNSISAKLLGSCTEKLVELNFTYPIFIIKNEISNTNFFNKLLHL